jgi:mRNA interferase MazF
VLVLQNDDGIFNSPTLIVAPMSSRIYKRTDLPAHVVLDRVEGLNGPSLVMLEQIKTIDKKRVKSYIGRFTRGQMEMIDDALSGTLGINIPETVEAP